MILISRAPKGARPAPEAAPLPPLPEPPKHGVAPGRVYVNVVDRPMKAVLDYFSRVGGHRIVAVDESIKDTKVTLRVEHLGWRVALDVIAEKYSLAVRKSEKEERTLLLERR